MTPFFWDTETDLIAPGRQAPPISVMSACWLGQEDATLLQWGEAGAAFEALLDDPNVLFVGANTAFDMTVMAANYPLLLPKIFAAYDADRVVCVLIRQKLLDIASGCYRGFLNSKQVWIPFQYNLDAVTKRHSSMRLNKDDAVRLTYGPLRDVPIHMWPEAHRIYAKEDAIATRECWLGQEKKRALTPHVDVLADQYWRARYDFAFRLMSTWGLRTDEQAVRDLERMTLDQYKRLEAILIEESLVRADGTRDTKAAKERMLRVSGFRKAADYREAVRKKDHKAPANFSFEPIPGATQRKMHLTDSGDVSLSADACNEVDELDPVLGLYGELGEHKAILSKDVKALLTGIYFPIHARFDIAASGRSTTSGPNIQNWRRMPGIREAFRPRPGRVFAQADVEGLELCTLAQACFDLIGYSKLGDAINAGLDVHLDLAAAILNISYDEAKRRKKLGDSPHVAILLALESSLKRTLVRTDAIGSNDSEFADYLYYIEVVNARQTAKVANFGFPGGLGIDKMVIFAKATYGVIISRERCEWLKDQWLRKWPEMNEYFAWVNSQMGGDGEGTVMQLRSQRIRGGCSFCALANTMFQGLGADGTQAAAWALAKECYVHTRSVMYGSRPVNYIHDEFIVETDDRPEAHDVAMRLEQVMVESLQPWVPNIRVAAPPLLMRYWSKNAKAVHNDEGRLIPWH